MKRKREKQEKKLNESNEKTLRSEKIGLNKLHTTYEFSHILGQSSACSQALSANLNMPNLTSLASLKRKRRSFNQRHSSKKYINPSALTLLRSVKNVNPNEYNKDTLLKRMIDHFDTLDKDMHFEFCVSLRALKNYYKITKYFFLQGNKKSK